MHSQLSLNSVHSLNKRTLVSLLQVMTEIPNRIVDIFAAIIKISMQYFKEGKKSVGCSATDTRKNGM